MRRSPGRPERAQRPCERQGKKRQQHDHGDALMLADECSGRRAGQCQQHDRQMAWARERRERTPEPGAPAGATS